MYFRVEVVFQFLVELVQIDGFDGNIARLFLSKVKSVSICLLDKLMSTVDSDRVQMMKQQSILDEAEGNSNMGRVRTATYRPRSFVYGSKASPADLIQSSVSTDSHLLVCWISRPPGGRRRGLLRRHDGRSDAGDVLMWVQLTIRGGAGSPLQVRV